MERLIHFLSELKDGEEFKEFISQCCLILPGDFPNLLKNYQEIFERFAKQLSAVISADPHMLPISDEEIKTAFSEGRAVLLTGPKFSKPVGFAKLAPWKDENGVVACREVGSVWVTDYLRGHGLGRFIINTLTNDLISNGRISDAVPLIAVVTHDNKPSNNLFSKIPDWQRVDLTTEQTSDFNHFVINGVNIFEGWGKPSSVYWYNKSQPF